MALTDKLIAIANAIREKTGSTDNYTLDQMATAIGEISVGGDQPTLFAPSFTYPSLNTLTWSTNNSNGGFSVSTTATIDGAVVTSPLEINDEIDGKNITITSSCDGFIDSSLTFLLEKQAPLSYSFVRNTAHQPSGSSNRYPSVYIGTSYGWYDTELSYDLSAISSKTIGDYKLYLCSSNWYSNGLRYVVTINNITKTYTYYDSSNWHQIDIVSDFNVASTSVKWETIGCLITGTKL